MHDERFAEVGAGRRVGEFDVGFGFECLQRRAPELVVHAAASPCFDENAHGQEDSAVPGRDVDEGDAVRYQDPTRLRPCSTMGRPVLLVAEVHRAGLVRVKISARVAERIRRLIDERLVAIQQRPRTIGRDQLTVGR